MNEEPYGSIWTTWEVEATVRSYLSMLLKELRGLPYNKASENALLRQSVVRTRGAVEYKYQNISAVLMRLGRLPIRGYKPAANYQASLIEAVVQIVQEFPELDDLMRSVATAANTEAPAVIGRIDIVQPPNLVVEVESGSPSGIRRNYLELAERNATLGLAGERAVLVFEQSRLAGLGLGRLAGRIEHVSQTLGDGLGFDVRSFNDDGTDRLIEVKTTLYAAETPFFLTPTELAVSEAHPMHYYLYRLHKFGKRPEMFTLQGRLAETCKLRPSEYSAVPIVH